MSWKTSPIALANVMTIIAHAFEKLVLDLQNSFDLPPVDAVRPAACPCCGAPAGVPGALNLIGHGTYRRQVLGVAEATALVVAVRRILCRACGRTASILPDELHPRRWYSGGAILLALVLSLVHRKIADEIRAALGGQSETRRWRTLERWKRQLLDPLWRWHAAELGYGDHHRSRDRDDRATRLRRLLGRIGASDRSPPDELAVAARYAMTNTAHTRKKSWRLALAC